MNKIILKTAPDYIALENELCKQVKHTPLDKKILILTSTRELRKHLIVRLAPKRPSCSIYISTLFKFAEELFDEATIQGLKVQEPHVIEDEKFFIHLLKHILQSQFPKSNFSKYILNKNIVGALYSTIRDLWDARLEPEIVEELINLFTQEVTRYISAVKNTNYSETEKKKALLQFLQDYPLGKWKKRSKTIIPEDILNKNFSELTQFIENLQSIHNSLIDTLRIYKHFLTEIREKGIISLGELFKNVQENIKNSEIIKQFSTIIFYGFYDLTQAQLDLFSSIASVDKATKIYWYFPLVTKENNKPYQSFNFPYKFYFNFLKTSLQTKFEIQELKYKKTDTLFKESYKYLFEPEKAKGNDSENINASSKKIAIEIASYPDRLTEIKHTAYKILELNEKYNVSFSDMMVVAQNLDQYSTIFKIFDEFYIPYQTNYEFPAHRNPKIQMICKLLEFIATQPDYSLYKLIDFLIAYYSIYDTKSVLELSKLKKTIESGENYIDINSFLSIIDKNNTYSRDIYPTCFELTSFINNLRPKEKWSYYVDEFRKLFRKLFNFKEGNGVNYDKHIDNIFSQIENYYHLITEEIELAEYILILQEAFREVKYDFYLQSKDIGVKILNTLSARWLTTKFLFVLGFQEGIFPRIPQEDNFLPDSIRRYLIYVLGNKIPEKGDSDEEKFIFQQLLSSVYKNGKIYFSYTRTDKKSEPTLPSSFTNELKKVAEVTETVVPKNIIIQIRERSSTRYKHIQLQEALLINLSSIISKKIPAKRLLALPDNLRYYLSENFNKVKLIDTKDYIQWEFDGKITNKPGNLINEISATSLNNYLTCPFKFFVGYILGLKPTEEKLNKGNIIHDVLKNADKQDEIVAALHNELTRFIPQNTLLYETLFNEILTISQIVFNFLEDYVSKISQYTKKECKIASNLKKYNINITGYIDRYDFTEDCLVITDYKYTDSKSWGRYKLNFYLIQAFLYSYLLKENLKSKKPISFAFLEINKHSSDEIIKKHTVIENYLEKDKDFKKLLNQIITSIQKGNFSPLPDKSFKSSCRYCEYKFICRKNHSFSAYRFKEKSKFLQDLNKKLNELKDREK